MSLEICNMPAFADVSDRRAQSLKVLEEASELCEASKWYIHNGAVELRTAMLDELADVMQTLQNFAACFEITDAEISQAVQRCIERNEERGRY